MHTQNLWLKSDSPGTQHRLQVLHFGPATGPKATIQAALHADEVPALLVAHSLRLQLLELEAQGQLLGPVQLLPYANPIGLAQQVLGAQVGRFDARDGVNFNRLYPDLAQSVGDAMQGRLTDDAAANVALVRAALCQAVSLWPAAGATQDLKKTLIQLAIDSDVVLDLHCDNEAVMHLYALTPQADWAKELGRWLGARAVLLATESGDMPFDEACTRPWYLLQQRYPEHQLPLACFASTVELRGQADTDHAQAAADAQAIINFLRRRGIVAGAPPELPPALCEPSLLAASEPISAPSAGVVVFHQRPGDVVAAQTLIADVVDVQTGAVTAIRCQSAGVLYARVATRWAYPGQRLAKVAGTTLARTGHLLSA